EHPVPFVVGQLGGVLPGAQAGLAGHIRPRVVGVGSRVRPARRRGQGAGEGSFPLWYRNRIVSISLAGSSGRTGRGTRNVGSGRRSGTARLRSASRNRYLAPADPPVPILAPIIRCTIKACRYRQVVNPSSTSTSSSISR